MKIVKNHQLVDFNIPVTVPKFTGATTTANGKPGSVPAPTMSQRTKFLRGDGTWAVVPTTDTKVTNTLNTTAKAYITGTTKNVTNTDTQVFDTGVYLDTTAGTLVAKVFKTSTGIEIS